LRLFRFLRVLSGGGGFNIDDISPLDGKVRASNVGESDQLGLVEEYGIADRGSKRGKQKRGKQKDEVFVGSCGGIGGD
jgi:hypothetical protein